MPKAKHTPKQTGTAPAGPFPIVSHLSRPQMQVTNYLAAASLAAYTYYKATVLLGAAPAPPPIGPFRYLTSFSGYDVVFGTGYEENFGLVYISQSGSTKTALVAFRGTSTRHDKYEDAAYEKVTFQPYDTQGKPVPDKVQVHSGDYSVYTYSPGAGSLAMRAQLFAILDRENITNCLLTGHSLGGALSQLFMLDLVASRPNVQVKTINFASPQVGDASWQAACRQTGIDQQLLRIVNTCDWVQGFPANWAPSYGYVSVGSEFRTTFDVVSDWVLPTTREKERHSLNNLMTVLDHAFAEPNQQWVGRFMGYYGDRMVSSDNPVPSEVMARQLQLLRQAYALTEPYFEQALAREEPDFFFQLPA